MDNIISADNFSEKFNQLNEQNRRYIFAIQQALLFAQDAEKIEKDKMQKINYQSGIE